MSIQKNVNTINALLERVASRRQFRTSRERTVYELGFVIGLLAKLMNDDSLVRHSVETRLKK